MDEWTYGWSSGTGFVFFGLGASLPTSGCLRFFGDDLFLVSYFCLCAGSVGTTEGIAASLIVARPIAGKKSESTKWALQTLSCFFGYQSDPSLFFLLILDSHLGIRSGKLKRKGKILSKKKI